MCLLAYAGFLRFSELVSIRRSDIVFNSDHIAVFIAKSKTDIYRDGNWRLIARTSCDTCPVNMLERDLNRADIKPDSEEFVFRSLSYCKRCKNCKLRGSNALSYTRDRELLLDLLESIGLNKKHFGLHA